MKKKRIYDLVIIICLSIISESDIFSYFINNNFGIFLDIALRLSFIVYAFIKIYKNNIGRIELRFKPFKILLSSPIFIITISNLFVILFARLIYNTTINFNYKLDIVSIIKIALTALCEELTFRSILYKEIEKNNSVIKSILISSLIFGLAHLLNINSLSSIVPCLIQAGYSFFIGLLASFLYYYTDNFIVPLLFHYLFNLLNGYLIDLLGVIEWNYLFFIVNISLGLLILTYSFILLKGDLKNVKRNMDI